MSELLNKLNSGYYKDYKKNGVDITIADKLLLWYYDVYKTDFTRPLSDVSYTNILNGLNISNLQYHLIMDYLENINFINNDGITKEGIDYTERNTLVKEQINTNVNKPLLEDMEYKRQYKAYLTWLAEKEFCKRAGIEYWIPFDVVLNIIKVSAPVTVTIGNSLLQSGILTNIHTGSYISPKYSDYILNKYLQIAFLEPKHKNTLQYFYNIFTTNPNRITRIHDQSEYYPSIEKLVSDGYLYRNSVSDEFKLTHKGLVYCICNFETAEFIKSKTNYTLPKICTGFEKPDLDKPFTPLKELPDIATKHKDSILSWLAYESFCKQAFPEYMIRSGGILKSLNISTAYLNQILEKLRSENVLEFVLLKGYIFTSEEILKKYLVFEPLDNILSDTMKFHYELFNSDDKLKLPPTYILHNCFENNAKLATKDLLYVGKNNLYELTSKGLAYCIFTFGVKSNVEWKEMENKPESFEMSPVHRYETPQHYSAWKEIFDGLPKKTTGKVENSGPSKETIDYIKTQQLKYDEQSNNIIGHGQNTYGQLGNSGAVRGRTYTHLIMDELPYKPNPNCSAYVNVDEDDLENELFLYYIDQNGVNVSIDPNDFTINNPILLLDENKIIHIFQSSIVREEVNIDINNIEHGFIEEDDVLQLAEYLSNNTKWECIYVVNKQIILSRVDISTQIYN